MPESILREPSSDRGRKTTPARPSHRGDSSGPFETTRAANFVALLRRRVRGVASPLPASRHPILPWALFPSKVHSRSAPAWSMPGPADAGGPKPAAPSTQDRFLRPIRAPLGSLRRLPLEAPAAPPEGETMQELRDEPGGRSQLRAARLFSAPSEARDRAPHPSVRPKPSWRGGKCRRSLSGGEVVSP